MNHKFWHKDFQCNGRSFASEKEIISFIEQSFPDLSSFINEWFGKEGEISMQTSGSTGTPKTIKLRRVHMMNSAEATGKYFDLRQGTRALLCLPLGFIAGRMMLVRAMVLGWNLDIIDPKSRVVIHKTKFYDFSAMVPLQVSSSIDQLERIQTLIVGGGQMSDSLIADISDLKTEVFATFGMTETITHIALSAMNTAASPNFEEKTYTALPKVTFSLDGRDCLVIQAPMISNDEIVTNDLVELISETSFRWLGRYDNVINSGGVKLIPELIEIKLGKIIESPFFIFGAQDELLGQKLMLIVEGHPKPDLLYDIAQYQRINQELMSKFEVPKQVFFIEEFHRTRTGKVKRSETIKSL